MKKLLSYFGLCGNKSINKLTVFETNKNKILLNVFGKMREKMKKEKKITSQSIFLSTEKKFYFY